MSSFKYILNTDDAQVFSIVKDLLNFTFFLKQYADYVFYEIKLNNDIIQQGILKYNIYLLNDTRYNFKLVPNAKISDDFELTCSSLDKFYLKGEFNE